MLASAVKLTKLLRKACGLISKLNTIFKKKQTPQPPHPQNCSRLWTLITGAGNVSPLIVISFKEAILNCNTLASFWDYSDPNSVVLTMWWQAHCRGLDSESEPWERSGNPEAGTPAALCHACLCFLLPFFSLFPSGCCSKLGLARCDGCSCSVRSTPLQYQDCGGVLELGPLPKWVPSNGFRQVQQNCKGRDPGIQIRRSLSVLTYCWYFVMMLFPFRGSEEQFHQSNCFPSEAPAWLRKDQLNRTEQLKIKWKMFTLNYSLNLHLYL